MQTVVGQPRFCKTSKILMVIAWAVILFITLFTLPESNEKKVEREFDKILNYQEKKDTDGNVPKIKNRPKLRDIKTNRR
jgi:hypothetical protein